MRKSPVSWRSSAFAPILLATLAACQGSIGAHGASPGQGGSAPTGAAAATGTGASGTAGATGTAGSAGSSATGLGGAGAGGTVDPVVMACMASNGMLNAGLTPARRLTRDQFNNTVRDLVGATGTPADALALDEKIGPFNSNAIAPVDATLVQQHQEVAATLADGREGAHGADRALRPERRHRHQHHLRDALRDRVRQARLPPSARGVRGLGLRRALHARQAGRRRAERVPPGGRGDAAVAVLPLSPRRRRHRHAAGGDRRRSRPTSWRRACRTSSGTRCPTTRCSRAPRTGRSRPTPC